METSPPRPGGEDLERAIVDRGRTLLDRMEPQRLISLTPAWWQERLLEWASEDPDFRVKLLRFVDVLPALRTSRSVADHLRQYFKEDVPGAVRLGAKAGRTGLFRPIVSRLVRQGVHTMAGRFIAGSTPEEALSHLQALVRDGSAFTVDLLGEATLSDTEADAYLERYLDVLRIAAEARTRWDAGADTGQVNVSIKLSALSARFEPAAPRSVITDVEPRLLPILRLARQHGAFVNIDMEQYRYKDLVHEVFAGAMMRPEFRGSADVGIVVQAYLRDAPDDIERLRELAIQRGSPITVRLVKGAYWDEETIVARQEAHPVPVFEDKASTDASYERCTELLLAAYPHLRPAFASHNPRSVAQAMVRSERAKLPSEHVEFQVLYGMAEGLRRAMQEQGCRTRVYVPIGEIIPGMAYLVRRLLENTSNESWLLHLHEDADPKSALAEPVPSPPEPAPSPTFRNHPHAEFHLPTDRARMQEAIEDAGKAPWRDEPLRIGGTEVVTGAWDEIRAPAHPGHLLGRVARAGLAEVQQAVGAATSAFPEWRDAPGAGRAEVLRQAAALIAGRRFELAALEVFESAKPWREADGDVTEAIDFLRYYALQAEEIGMPADLSQVPAEGNYLLHEGRGVVAIIAPWNFPLAIITGMTAGALAGGCAAILKPAEQSPIVAARLVDILGEAGVPPGVVNYLPGPGEVVGEALVRHPGIAMIAFTGSNAVGTQIYESASRVVPGQPGLKRVIAELGGKNAIVIDDDADLDQAVAGTIASAFHYAGQKCSACSRVIVVGTAHEEFRTRLAAAVESLPAGPPEDPSTVVPPVISAEAQAKIESYLEIALREGKLLARGAEYARGHYVAPHVFEALPPESRVLKEEIFGPVLALSAAPDFETAIGMAVDSPYALTGGVYSRNPRNIAFARRHFRVGNLYINRAITGSMAGRQPFAGLKLSGTGEKAGGPGYVREFTITRVITENTMRRGFAPGAHPGQAHAGP
jgi:RHH-type proline utilization regulon transcriptional repressor/proline dehydrogenase/delta 1-pyrroline-5-carboxylate dehydrogenase